MHAAPAFYSAAGPLWKYTGYGGTPSDLLLTPPGSITFPDHEESADNSEGRTPSAQLFADPACFFTCVRNFLLTVQVIPRGYPPAQQTDDNHSEILSARVLMPSSKYQCDVRI
jgi:hypothetical protein